MASSRSMRRVAVLFGLLGALVSAPSAAQAAIPKIPSSNARRRHHVHRPDRRQRRPALVLGHLHDLRRRADRHQRRLPARARERPGRQLPDRRRLPRLGRLEARRRPRADWVNDGYAFFSMSDRGWGNSCGGTDPKRLQPVCAERLQPPDGHPLRGPRRAGDLRGARRPPADGATGGEGLIDPQAIGVTGGSYGGGISMALGGPEGPQDDPGRRRHADPVGERRRQADADRGGAARHPVDRSRLLAAAERAHARLRRRLPLPGARPRSA